MKKGIQTKRNQFLLFFVLFAEIYIQCPEMDEFLLETLDGSFFVLTPSHLKKQGNGRLFNKVMLHVFLKIEIVKFILVA